MATAKPAPRKRNSKKETREAERARRERVKVRIDESRLRAKEQAKQSRSDNKRHLREVRKGRLTPSKLVLTLLVLAAVGAGILYPAARTYYITVRNNDRLDAELTAIQQRNDTIQSQIDTLSTDEGVADEARTELGWVVNGENSVTVTGIGNTTSSTTLPATVDTSTISAPTTWYSRILDRVFFVDTSEPAAVDSASGDDTGNAASSVTSNG